MNHREHIAKEEEEEKMKYSKSNTIHQQLQYEI